jgi:hypothetical protein
MLYFIGILRLPFVLLPTLKQNSPSLLNHPARQNLLAVSIHDEATTSTKT